MYQSHTSYSRYAHMGHAMTDKLVAACRAAGPEAGFFGAKITGGGCGGTVAILIRDDPDTRGRVQQIREQYEQETGRETTYFDGTGPGAAATGTMTVSV
jgi:L-arabinokinase